MSTTLSAYISSAPTAERATLKGIRSRIKEHLPDAKERIGSNGFPVYADGEERAIAGFAHRRRGAMLYIMDADVVDAFATELGCARTGRSCILWRATRSLDESTLGALADRMLDAARERAHRDGVERPARVNSTAGEPNTRRTATSRRWRDKLEQAPPMKIVDIPPRMQRNWGKGKMAIADPRDVERIMRRVRKGRVATVLQVMGLLANEYGVDAVCPMTTGIFMRTIAETAEEDRAVGEMRITPYWRTIKSDGSLNPKFPGGAAAQAERLSDEGIAIAPAKGKRAPKVVDYERRMAKL